MALNETIVKAKDFLVRHRGRVIVSKEKDWALDYVLSFVLGIVDSEGHIIPGKKPSIIIFVDDSASQVFSVYLRFKYNALIDAPVASVLYEPTVEMCSHRPKDSDNPFPGILESIYQFQLSGSLRLPPNSSLVEFIYKVHNIPLVDCV